MFRHFMCNFDNANIVYEDINDQECYLIILTDK